jgi:hypothetical protein
VPNAEERTVYFNSITEVFLFHITTYGSWFVGNACGVYGGIAAYGGAGEYPFQDTDATWMCGTSTSYAAKPVSIECSYYDVLPCVSGSYEPAGGAPDGVCR